MSMRIHRIVMTIAAAAWCASCASSPPTSSAAAPGPMVAELTSVLALHGWPCDRIVTVELAQEHWASVTCRDGNVYEVLVRQDWDWHALERQTQLQPMIEIGEQSELLSAGDPAVRRSASDALGDLGSAAGPAVPALTRTLADEDASVRQSAAQALGKIGPASTSAVPALTAALDDPDPEVRASAADALAAIRGP